MDFQPLLPAESLPFALNHSLTLLPISKGFVSAGEILPAKTFSNNKQLLITRTKYSILYLTYFLELIYTYFQSAASRNAHGV